MSDWLFPAGLFAAAFALLVLVYSCAADDCASRGGTLVQTGQHHWVCFEKGVVVE